MRLSGYKTVGVFEDSDGQACLPLQPLASTGPLHMQEPILLYSEACQRSVAKVAHAGQWCCTSEGRGDFLHRVSTGGEAQVQPYTEVCAGC